MSKLIMDFRNIVPRGVGGLPFVAKHIGVETSKVIAFYEGGETALTPDEQLKLHELIQDFFKGNTPQGGFFEDENGIVNWVSKV